MRSETRAVREAFDELCAYTLSLRDVAFIHQHVVDAFAAQHAEERGKPITITFALIGLYLHLEKGFTGRQVQLAHMALARRKRVWPNFKLPPSRGSVTAIEVLAAEPGPHRDRAIDDWCLSVWTAFGASHETIATLLEDHGITPSNSGSSRRSAGT
jgi:hypothetical protein